MIYESYFDSFEYKIQKEVDEMKCQLDSIEKSIKDTNKKITAIRNQLRKEKGRGDLS